MINWPFLDQQPTFHSYFTGAATLPPLIRPSIGYELRGLKTGTDF